MNGLRTRLWLSYAALISLLLLVVAAALITSLVRNPNVYRARLPLLEVAERNVEQEVSRTASMPVDRLVVALKRLGEQEGFRFLITDSAGEVIADGGQTRLSIIRTISVQTMLDVKDAGRPGILRDNRRLAWMYSALQLDDGRFLVTLTRLPRLPLLTVLRNEVLSPIIWSGLVALVISFLLALATSAWITNPLQRMASTASRLAAGEEIQLPTEGPDEVRALSRALSEMQRKVLAGQQAQRDFTANVSHELKTPLTSIQGFSQAILDGTVQTPEALQEAANVIHQEAGRMHRLVQELLVLTRLESGTADLKNEPLDLRDILQAVVTRLTPQASHSKVNLRLSAPEMDHITGDGDRLGQVFNNLVENAIKFSPAGGTVTITVSLDQQCVQVDV
ncbi:MAG: HAMP domain-containing protein, partial [Anaerolineae bacterium]|nr:HAMP domain-containing protein [Anaerolineae bacterium]